MSTRLSAFVIWALVALVAMFWGLRLTAASTSAPANTVAVDETINLRGDVARLFGAEQAATAVAAAPVDSRFKLIGVMAGRPNDAGDGNGVALIAIDDKPPRPFVSGARIDERLVLKSVSRRSASLGPADGGATMVLEIPPMALPATGTLPPTPAGIETASPPGAINAPGAPPSMNGAPPQFAPREVRPAPGTR